MNDERVVTILTGTLNRDTGEVIIESPSREEVLALLDEIDKKGLENRIANDTPARQSAVALVLSLARAIHEHRKQEALAQVRAILEGVGMKAIEVVDGIDVVDAPTAAKKGETIN